MYRSSLYTGIQIFTSRFDKGVDLALGDDGVSCLKGVSSNLFCCFRIFRRSKYILKSFQRDDTIL